MTSTKPVSAQAEVAMRDARAATESHVSETAQQARSYSEDAVDTVKALVNLYPLQSFGVAVATGYLFAALLRKK